MSASQDDNPVGCEHPRTHRRKKGRSAKPRRKRSKKSESTVAMIDGLLAEPVPITFNGESKKVPAIEAILLQLMQQEMAGNARAARVLLKYRTFAAQNAQKQFEVIFEDSDYTRALSGKLEPEAND